MKRSHLVLIVIAIVAIAAVGTFGVISYLNSIPSQSFVIRYAITDYKDSITGFSLLNNGTIPVQLVKMYLYRSDGLLVNSTDLSLPSIPAHEVANFNCSISYNLATVSELYHIKLVSSDGAFSVSPDIPLTCNCH